jgi:hypothetical protein
MQTVLTFVASPVCVDRALFLLICWTAAMWLARKDPKRRDEFFHLYVALLKFGTVRLVGSIRGQGQMQKSVSVRARRQIAKQSRDRARERLKLREYRARKTGIQKRRPKSRSKQAPRRAGRGSTIGAEKRLNAATLRSRTRDRT